MNYKQAMKWARKHPKGTKQPVIMSTGSGFWPARSWLEGNYWPYVKACETIGVTPVDTELFYHWTTGKSHYQRTPETYALMTQMGTILK